MAVIRRLYFAKDICSVAKNYFKIGFIISSQSTLFKFGSLASVPVRSSRLYGHSISSIVVLTRTMSDLHLEEPVVSPRSEAELADLPAEPETDTSEGNTLSKRAQKRLKRCRKWNTNAEERHAKKQKKRDIDIDVNSETSYYHENGLRKVYPYKFTFTTHAKGRWLGRKLVDILGEEFKHLAPGDFIEKVSAGEILVNEKCVSADYILKNNDFISHSVHRHEVPITADPIEIIHDSDDLLVINKPSSVPCHPCGNFRHNSVIFILEREFGYKKLRFVHRLDRLTSGVMLLAKNEQTASKICNQISSRQVEKEYVARVDGVFPEGVVECTEPLELLSHKLGLQFVSPTGKEARTTFYRLSTNGTSSVVKCLPHTGRTHQIRVHLQWLGFPIVNDPLYHGEVWGPNKGKHGHFGKNTDELISQMLADHSRLKYVFAEISRVNSTLTNTESDTTDNKTQETHYTELDTGNTHKTDALNKQLSREDKCSVGNDNNRADHERGSDLKLLDSKDTDNHVLTADIAGQDALTFAPDKVTFDPNCVDCLRRFKDPSPAQLVMFLHALRYKGPDWEFCTKMPSWTSEDRTESPTTIPGLRLD